MNSHQNSLLSVCCLGYNHAEYLQENLESICNIGYNNIEIIVVDDGSQDDSIERLHQLASQIPYKLDIIAQDNTGNIGKNFNNALRKTQGEFVTFISLDDVFHAKVMLSEIKTMNANPKLAFIASSKAISIDSDGIVNENHPTQLKLHNMPNPSVADLLELEYAEFGSFYLQGSIIRKELLEAIDGFDEDMTGDDIILRTKLFNFMLEHPNWNFTIIKENNVFYRMHENNIHKNIARQIKIVTEYLAKYWPNRANPEILISWVTRLINHTSFSEYIRALTLNQRASSLLNEPKIQHLIEQSLKPNSFFKRFIFSKKKINNRARQIILFGCIKFSYTKKNKKLVKTKNIHFSQYTSV